MTPTIGGLFEGYGGLTMAARSVLGGSLAWYSEIEPAACRLLAHHHPDVPNLGDVTAVDWSAVPGIDVLAGGFPCQDVSSAGLRRGIRPGTRSGLWEHFAYAIDQLRPGLVLIENVRGLLSADAASDLEPCSWCVGDDEGRHLRALGAVLGGLADLGYDARWIGLRAADVGAPHGRFRVFIAARAIADAHHVGPVRPGTARGRRGRPANHGRAPADPSGVGRHEGGAESAGLLGGPHAPVGRDDVPSDPPGGRHPHEQECGVAARQHVGPVPGAGGRDRARRAAEGVRDLDGPTAVVAWGPYEPAVRRWELILGRTAPAPTQRSSRGREQLAPPFVEWMMGLPAGHVTGVPGLSRAEQLKALGNGVVPQQAAAALAELLGSWTVDEAAA